jgi:hypothetical protein
VKRHGDVNDGLLRPEMFLLRFTPRSLKNATQTCAAVGLFSGHVASSSVCIFGGLRQDAVPVQQERLTNS